MYCIKSPSLQDHNGNRICGFNGVHYYKTARIQDYEKRIKVVCKVFYLGPASKWNCDFKKLLFPFTRCLRFFRRKFLSYNMLLFETFRELAQKNYKNLYWGNAKFPTWLAISLFWHGITLIHINRPWEKCWFINCHICNCECKW